MTINEKTYKQFKQMLVSEDINDVNLLVSILQNQIDISDNKSLKYIQKLYEDARNISLYGQSKYNKNFYSNYYVYNKFYDEFLEKKLVNLTKILQ